jgi:hypothetical protein
MDDVDYAEKYSQPYGDDKPERMLKQMVDARHLQDKSGVTLGGGGAGSPVTAGAKVGGFYYPTPWFELNGALTGLAGTGAHDWFIGPEVGMRIQTPTRVAPFAGVGGFLGLNRFDEKAENDRVDNDDDGRVDEFGEEKENFKAFTAIYPEVGIHAWLTGSTRLTASARYYVTEEGRDDDFWFIGFSVSKLLGPVKNDNGRVWTDEEMPYAEPVEVQSTDGTLQAVYERPVGSQLNDKERQALYGKPEESESIGERGIGQRKQRIRIVDFYDELSIADNFEPDEIEFNDVEPGAQSPRPGLLTD